MAEARPFLTAEWRNLVMLNYEVDPACLQPLVPAGTELDLWQGRTLVSLVGFRFLRTRLKGWAIPFHQNFSEVNLRFYVRRETSEGVRRGVVFIREIVPKMAVTLVANTVYHEHYITLPMTQRIQLPGSPTDRTGRIEYGWRQGTHACRLWATFSGLPAALEQGSEAEFITEHYWGYTRQPDGATAEYQVDHPAWRVWQTDSAGLEGDVTRLYGPAFAEVLAHPPCSSLVAEGSAVTVYPGQRLENAQRTPDYAAAKGR